MYRAPSNHYHVAPVTVLLLRNQDQFLAPLTWIPSRLTSESFSCVSVSSPYSALPFYLHARASALVCPTLPSPPPLATAKQMDPWTKSDALVACRVYNYTSGAIAESEGVRRGVLGPRFVAAASNDSASSKSSEETKEQINAEPSKAPESPTENKAEQ